MIKEKHLETVLWAKEFVSSDSGTYKQSMAPCLGGQSHGNLSPIEKLHPFSSSEWDVNGVREGKITVYHLSVMLISIDPIETMKVFLECKYDYVREMFVPVYAANSVDALLAAWAYTLYETMNEKEL